MEILLFFLLFTFYFRKILPHLSKFIENFAGVKVLVVGDVMLDRYLWGNVSRISPEAPVPIVNVNKTSLVLGGAANVAANIAGLGAKPILVGICGSDKEGDALSELLENKQISNELVHIENRQTTIKTRIVAHHQHVARIDQETTDFISDEESEKIFEKIIKLFDKVSLIIISDYAKGFLTEKLLARLINTCLEKNKKIIIDPKGKDFSKYKGATILTPNRREAAEATGFDENEPNLIEKAGDKLFKEIDAEALLITQGEKGMTLLQKTGENFHLEALARNVFDVTGAGDTVIAGFAVAIGAGASFLEAAKIANIAAGLVVGEVGTTAISLETLEKAVKSYQLSE